MTNKKNLMYFEGSTMRDLHKKMEAWQSKNKKRFMSVNIEREGSLWCCIALSNPTEVVLTDEAGNSAIKPSHFAARTVLHIKRSG